MKTWDIFCRVVDNYGDIGVCWRLARQLAAEYPLQVNLWVDDIESLMRICPEARSLANQRIANVNVRIWPDLFPEPVFVADVVIEAFACELPASYLANMIALKRAGSPPRWFNLEYLSAEDWVEDCHSLDSMHPPSGLKKTYFFPGFTSKTGGLLCEASLLAERDQFIQDPQKTAAFLSSLGVHQIPGAMLISLFAYENAAIGSLLDIWQQSASPLVCLVPEGKILTSINQHLSTRLSVKDEIQLCALFIKVIPFVTQQDYDYLLWACDINFVRGEDSFVRAQWAAKPMVWHIYPQEDDVHLIKLDAFLNKYTENMPDDLAEAVKSLWLGWNQQQNCGQLWNHALKQQQNWSKQAGLWAGHLNSLGDLASNMVHFCQKTL